MWPNMDASRTGFALSHASTVGAVLSAPFAGIPDPQADDALARHRWEPEEARHASNDDHSGSEPLFARLARSIRSWQDRRALETALLSMDEHQLTDIGLTRGDIDDVVAGRYRRPTRRA